MSTEPIPAAGKRVRVRLDDSDGDACHRFTKDGPVELWLTALEQPADAAGADDRHMIVLTVTLPNFPLARRHARRLELCAGALEAAIFDAQIDVDAPIPARDDGHRHVVRFARYSRSIPVSAECEVCMETLVEDVAKWLGDRGYTHSGNVLAEPMNAKNLIDAAVNRDG